MDTSLLVCRSRVASRNDSQKNVFYLKLPRWPDWPSRCPRSLSGSSLNGLHPKPWKKLSKEQALECQNTSTTVTSRIRVELIASPIIIARLEERNSVVGHLLSKLLIDLFVFYKPFDVRMPSHGQITTPFSP
jgi:hypothetical protein